MAGGTPPPPDPQETPAGGGGRHDKPLEVTMSTDEMIDAALAKALECGWHPLGRRARSSPREGMRAVLDAALEARARRVASTPPHRRDKRQRRWAHVPPEMRPADVA